jgi:hypothetical protein
MVAFASVTELMENPAVRWGMPWIRPALSDPGVAQIPATEKLRVVILFALRYEREARPQVNQLLETLAVDDNRHFAVRARIMHARFCSLSASHLLLLQTIVNGMLSQAGESKRTGDLFGNKNLFARASKIVGGLKVRVALAGWLRKRGN